MPGDQGTIIFEESIKLQGRRREAAFTELMTARGALSAARAASDDN